MGQDPIINVALAYGFADIALRHKSQRSQGGSPARDQSRIWSTGLGVNSVSGGWRWADAASANS